MLNFHKTLYICTASFTLLLMIACSSPQPKNQWQYEAVIMINAYQKHFLQGKTNRANLDLRHARQRSKQSADFKTLIDVELTVCAMQLSILAPIPCDNAKALIKIQPNAQQEAYLALLNSSLKKEDIDLLPKQYQDFTQALLSKDTLAINEALTKVEPLSSRLISSSLVPLQINKQNIAFLIKELSISGYKRPLIPWLKIQASQESNITKKNHIQAKIKILLSH